MQTSAKMSSVRISPRKARLVADQVRGKSVAAALELLTFSPKKSSDLIIKVLKSAIANAQYNQGADVDDLYIAEIFVNQAGVYKRFHMRARGRINRILKRLSHITVVVSDDKKGAK